MFEAVSKNSSLSKRCDGHDEQDRLLHKEIAALNKRCNELKTNIDNVEKSAENNLKLSQAKQHKVNEKFKKNFEEVKKEAKEQRQEGFRQYNAHNKL